MIEHVLQQWGEPSIPRWSCVRVNSVGATDVGVVRDSNQDGFCVCPEVGLYLVADGMGGRAGGEVASGLAVEVISQEFERQYESILKADATARRGIFSKIINMAALKIYERSLELPQYRGMGTTVSLLWIMPPQQESWRGRDVAVIAHVGDSRCYLLRAGVLYQITDDHSLVNEQLKTGILKKGDARILQIKNVITRCVGYQEEEEVDTYTLPIFAGDRFLLCSDGLSGKVSDLEISQYLAKEPISEIPRHFIELANSNGGEDNITGIVVEAG